MQWDSVPLDVRDSSDDLIIDREDEAEACSKSERPQKKVPVEMLAQSRSCRTIPRTSSMTKSALLLGLSLPGLEEAK